VADDYTYFWYDVSNGNTLISNESQITDLPSGIYFIEIHDDMDCIVSQEVGISDVEGQIDYAVQDVSCFSNSDGTIDITVSGGTEPYSYDWNGPGGFVSVDEDIADLAAGSYTISVTDFVGCSFVEAIEVAQPDSIEISFVVGNIDCSGIDNGSIDIDVSGGTPDFIFDWEGPGGYSSTDEDISGLMSGDYDLILEDANGCISELSVFVEDGSLLIIDINSTNSTCNESNGSATADVSGGADPVDITWFDELMNPIGSGDFISDLPAGQYFVTVSDGNGCEETLEVNISDSDIATIEAWVSDVSCYGQANGSIDLLITDGTEPYTFDWTGPDGFTSIEQNIWDLEAGSYNFTLTDGIGCSMIETYEVNEPDSLMLDADISDIPCNGGNDGAIDLIVSGGTAGFIFDWSGPGGFTSSSEDISDLAFGDYTVFVVDANLCMAQGTFFINESTELGLEFDWTPVLCSGLNEGQIDLTLQGGEPPYTFDWTGPNGFSSSDEDIQDLEPGDYTLSVTDNSFCSADTTLTIIQSPELILDLEIIQPSCLLPNGSIAAIPSGGTVTDAYSYFWYDVSNGNILISEDSLITDLLAGVYFVEVFDDFGCVASQEIGLSDNDGQIDYTVQDVSCYSYSDGTIDITVSGGTLPYSYDWDGPAGFDSNDEDITDLVSGSYTISVTDSVGCIFVEAIEVLQPDSIEITFTVGNVLCFGDSSGAVITTVTGGTPGYEYVWVSPNGYSADTPNLEDVLGGCYDLQVTDMNMCTATDQVCIDQPEAFEISAVIVPIDCFGDTTGSIELEITGGMPFYTYAWIGPDAEEFDTEDLFNLSAGAYDFQLTDQNGCTVDSTFVVGQSDELVVFANLLSPSCPGDGDGAIMLEIQGGQGSYDVSWTGDAGFSSDTQDIFDLVMGQYIYQATDSLGCSTTDTLDLADPDSLAVSAIITHISCFGANDGMIEIEITGGSPDYSTFWTGPDGFSTTAEDLIDLEPGSYEVTIGDENACILIAQFEIDEPSLLEVGINEFDNPSCPDSEDGGIDIDVFGGTPNYSFAWTGPGGFISTDEDIYDILPGFYDLVVQDANGCTFSIDNIELIPIILIEAIAPPDTIDCFGFGPWNFVGIQQDATDDYWTDIDGNILSFDSLLTIEPDPGTYTYIYYAENAPCSASDTLVVEILPPPYVDAGEDQEVYYEESVELGGVPTTDLDNTAYWMPVELLNDSSEFNPETVEMIETTEFVVTVMDMNGCTATDSVLITVIPEIDIPSGFSPNGDYQNDVWDIGNIDFYPKTSVEVYNRWGDLLYRSEGYYKPWDGTYNDQALPIGTYYFILKVNEPVFPDPITGPVTILR
jgi:gliding motility-associated-like protein